MGKGERTVFLGNNDRVAKSPSPNLKLSLPKELLTEASDDFGRELFRDKWEMEGIQRLQIKGCPIKKYS